MAGAAHKSPSPEASAANTDHTPGVRHRSEKVLAVKAELCRKSDFVPVAQAIRNTAAPVSLPLRMSPSASFARSSGYSVTSVQTGTFGASSRNSRPSGA